MTYRNLLLAAAAALVLAFPASAAKAALPAAGSGTISPDGTPTFGQPLTFTTTGTAGLVNPRIWIACYQAGVLVYGEGTGLEGTAKLGGGSSDWVSGGGGPADCTATLYYILGKNGKGEWKGGHQDQGGTVTLATVAFAAAG